MPSGNLDAAGAVDLDEAASLASLLHARAEDDSIDAELPGIYAPREVGDLKGALGISARWHSVTQDVDFDTERSSETLAARTSAASNTERQFCAASTKPVARSARSM